MTMPPPSEPASAPAEESADPILKVREERESEEIRGFRDQGRTALNLLYQLVRNFQLYEPDNVVFQRPVEEFDRLVRELTGSLGEVRLLLVEGQPYIGDLRIRLDSANTASVGFLANWLDGLGLGGWSFEPAPDQDSIRQFFYKFARTHKTQEESLEEMQLLASNGGFDWAAPHPPQRFRDEGEEELEEVGVSTRRAANVFEHGMAAVRGFFGMMGKTGVGPALDARKAINSIVDMTLAGSQHALAINMLTDSDNPLFTHSMHVANLSVAIGRYLDIPRQYLAELGLCGLFHDTGFAELPPDFGWAADGGDPKLRLQAHTVLGFRAQLRQRGYHQGRLVRALVNLEHHLDLFDRGRETWDDPRLPLHPFSRIVSVADAYDTLLTDTPTRQALLPPQALREIWAGRQTRFEGIVVQALVNLMGLFPFGTLVEISDGSLAVVMERGEGAASFDRPGIHVVVSGGTLNEGDLFDLSSVPPQELAIVAVHDPREKDIDLVDVLFPDKNNDDEN